MQFIVFKNWMNALNTSDLHPKLKNSFLITIRWYLGYLAERRSPATVESARQFIESVSQEKQPEPWLLERWKSALQWFFINAPAETQPLPLCLFSDNGASERTSRATAPTAHPA